MKELDFFDLHVTRLVGELAGLIKRVKNVFTLTRKCEALLAQGGPENFFRPLLETYVGKFNWAFRDCFSSQLEIIQQGWAFTLFLLSGFGSEWRPKSFYEDLFIRAFPMALDLVEPDKYFPLH